MCTQETNTRAGLKGRCTAVRPARFTRQRDQPTRGLSSWVIRGTVVEPAEQTGCYVPSNLRTRARTRVMRARHAYSFVTWARIFRQRCIKQLHCRINVHDVAFFIQIINKKINSHSLQNTSKYISGNMDEYYSFDLRHAV